MYKEWVDKALDVRFAYERLCLQRDEINKRIGILQGMAKELIDEGVDNFYSQRTFPEGRKHFSHFIYRLIRIVKGRRNNGLVKLNEGFR